MEAAGFGRLQSAATDKQDMCLYVYMYVNFFYSLSRKKPFVFVCLSLCLTLQIY